MLLPLVFHMNRETSKYNKKLFFITIAHRLNCLFGALWL